MKAATSLEKSEKAAAGETQIRAVVGQKDPDVHASRKAFMQALVPRSSGSAEGESNRLRNSSFTFQAVRNMLASRTLDGHQVSVSCVGMVLSLEGLLR